MADRINALASIKATLVAQAGLAPATLAPASQAKAKGLDYRQAAPFAVGFRVVGAREGTVMGEGSLGSHRAWTAQERSRIGALSGARYAAGPLTGDPMENAGLDILHIYIRVPTGGTANIPFGRFHTLPANLDALPLTIARGQDYRHVSTPEGTDYGAGWRYVRIDPRNPFSRRVLVDGKGRIASRHASLVPQGWRPDGATTPAPVPAPAVLDSAPAADALAAAVAKVALDALAVATPRPAPVDGVRPDAVATALADDHGRLGDDGAPPARDDADATPAPVQADPFSEGTIRGEDGAPIVYVSAGRAAFRPRKAKDRKGPRFYAVTGADGAPDYRAWPAGCAVPGEAN